MLPSPDQAGREHDEPVILRGATHIRPRRLRGAALSAPFSLRRDKPRTSPSPLRRCRSPTLKPQAASSREENFPTALSVRQGRVLCRPPRGIVTLGIIAQTPKKSIENLLPVVFLLRIDDIPPIQIPPVHAQHQHFRSSHIGRKGNIILVAQPANIKQFLIH